MRENQGKVDPFWVDLGVLAVSAPFLYFPSYFPVWTRGLALALLAAGWGWRRLRLGVWRAATPATPALDLLMLLLPVALWAAPAPLREQYSLPRALILLWNFALFWAVVTHAGRAWRFLWWSAAGFFAAATGIALLAPLGITWLYKFRPLQAILDRIPSPLVGVFQGAESGFHPNQVAGTLLYALPLMLALSGAGLRVRPRPRWFWLLLLATAVVFTVLVLTQSRAALLGLAVSVLFMMLVPWRWGRWLLVCGSAALLISIPFLPASLLDVLGGAPPVEALGGTSSLGFRQDVWTQAVAALHDFPFTGMGLGTFRHIVFLLYPIQVTPTYNLGHAHNFILQTGLDFGLFGLVALVAIYLTAAVALVYSGRCAVSMGGIGRGWVIGLAGSLAAQVVYGQLDAVAMGAKTNFMFWFWLALVFALGNLAGHPRAPVQAARTLPPDAG